MEYALIVPKIMEKNIQIPKKYIESGFLMKQIFFLGGEVVISHWVLIPEFWVPNAIKGGTCGNVNGKKYKSKVIMKDWRWDIFYFKIFWKSIAFFVEE